MATLPERISPMRTIRAKYVVFAGIAAMFVYVLFHNERFLIDAADPAWKRYETFKWWLLPHGLAGVCALLLAPLQFSDRLRARYARFHRITGRCYIVGVFIAAPLGFYIQYFEESLGMTRSFSIAAAVDAILWMTTTGIAFAFARKRMIPQHRAWMTRSFALAIVFLEVRVILGVSGWEALGPQAVETVVWVCLAFSLLIADIALQWQELARNRLPIPARSIA